jgi:hypothetical protein
MLCVEPCVGCPGDGSHTDLLFRAFGERTENLTKLGVKRGDFVILERGRLFLKGGHIGMMYELIKIITMALSASPFKQKPKILFNRKQNHWALPNWNFFGQPTPKVSSRPHTISSHKTSAPSNPIPSFVCRKHRRVRSSLESSVGQTHQRVVRRYCTPTSSSRSSLQPNDCRY